MEKNEVEWTRKAEITQAEFLAVNEVCKATKLCPYDNDITTTLRCQLVQLTRAYSADKRPCVPTMPAFLYINGKHGRFSSHTPIAFQPVRTLGPVGHPVSCPDRSDTQGWLQPAYCQTINGLDLTRSTMAWPESRNRYRQKIASGWKFAWNTIAISNSVCLLSLHRLFAVCGFGISTYARLWATVQYSTVVLSKQCRSL